MEASQRAKSLGLSSPVKQQKATTYSQGIVSNTITTSDFNVPMTYTDGTSNSVYLNASSIG